MPEGSRPERLRKPPEELAMMVQFIIVCKIRTLRSERVPGEMI
jgi:hypothetical protein